MIYGLSRTVKRRLRVSIAILAVAAASVGACCWVSGIRDDIEDIYASRIAELEHQLEEYEKIMNAVIDQGDDLRLVEYDQIDISSNIEPGDYVDVRIAFPDGQDYVVLSKKRIETLNSGLRTVGLCVNESEIKRMGSASFERGLQRGVILYMAEYTEPALQCASVPDYVGMVSEEGGCR